MRKVSGLLVAASLLVPATFFAATQPAGAATTPTCSTLTGTAKFTPPVPKAPAKAKSNIQLDAVFSKCTGVAGLVSGKVHLPLYKGQTAGNCSTLVTNPTKIVVPKGGTIKWNKGPASTFGPVTVTPAGLATYKATGKITAGQFKGKTVTETATFTPNGCPIKSAKLALNKGTKITVK
jgi:hypothetical protein